MLLRPELGLSPSLGCLTHENTPPPCSKPSPPLPEKGTCAVWSAKKRFTSLHCKCLCGPSTSSAAALWHVCNSLVQIQCTCVSPTGALDCAPSLPCLMAIYNTWSWQYARSAHDRVLKIGLLVSLWDCITGPAVFGGYFEHQCIIYRMCVSRKGFA